MRETLTRSPQQHRALVYTRRVRRPDSPSQGKAWVRLAQLRGRIATMARGGRYDHTARLLGELTRADLALGLPADALLRARQAAQLAEENGDPTAGPLVVLAATLLAAEEPAAAIDGARLAIDRATEDELPRIAITAQLVGGAAQRRLGHLAEARLLLDAARTGAAQRGDGALAGLALAELAWVDHAEGAPAAAATCLEFAAGFFRRAAQPIGALVISDEEKRRLARASAEADALAVASWAAAGDVAAATARAGRAADMAKLFGRPDLVAFLDGALADLALGARTPEDGGPAAVQACALAAESAELLGASPLSRDLRAQARLRQVRASEDVLDRERHLEAGIDLALGLPRSRAGARLGATLVGLLDDAVALHAAPHRGEVDRLYRALAGLGDADLAAMAESVLGELDSPRRW